MIEIAAVERRSERAAPKLVELYRDHAKDVFHLGLLGEAPALWGLTAPIYRQTNLQGFLVEMLGTDLTLGKLDPKRVVVPAFDLDNEGATERYWKEKFFHNYESKLGDQDTDRQERAVDVALRSGAAPIYFPSHQGYIDGGVAANNPSMAALAQAIDPNTGGQALGDLQLLSIGTGQNRMFINGEADWGAAHWGTKLVEILVDGPGGVADYQCARLLGEQYMRLNPLLAESMALDDAGKVEQLCEWAAKVPIGSVVEWLQGTFLK